MKIRFKGSSDEISFTIDKVYEADKLPEKIYGKNMYSIYDDTEDEYVYSLKYINNNFIIEE